ncbi:glucosaminidase domain-containing protein [Clostridium oryzae]|uniref:Exo-glucosaminidase LytG n=1 Tax=Clostridium oryzae TaxID=1450648 RepID=A0A1V4IW08_9CLOT|nr:glucosaminidase domain-containing protein [Clostridium oryzae]OPJ64136.1 Exo-glucosaminidase LytG precursor [Clostridium oryzae]
MSKKTFIKKVYPAAKAAMKKYDILASLTIAQAILESAWGRSKLTRKANNLFGIKADSSWKGKKVVMKTGEQRKNGRRYVVNAAFRKYENWADSIEDHGRFLSAERYSKVRGERDYRKACRAIKEAGYATDINYDKLLVSIIERNKLYNYDRLVPEYEYPGYEMKYAPHKEDENVRRIKRRLMELGYRYMNDDGKFGKGTRRAVKKFQKKNGLKADGIVGEKTWNKLFK